MSVLSHQSIKTRAGGSNPLIDPFEDRNCRSAGYDLRAGGDYYLAHTRDPKGEVEFGELNEKGGPLEIGRNQVALIAIRERLVMPRNLVGHITLKMDLLLRGIIMASQSQIDAGYEGNLTILLYNLSQRSVLINWDQSIVRVEFALLDQFTDRPYRDTDTFQNLPLRQAVREPIDSSLSDMERRVNEAEERVRWVSRRDGYALIGGGIAALGLILTVLLLMVTMYGPIQQEASNAQAAAGNASRIQGELNQAKTVEAQLKGAYADAAAQLASELTQAKAVETQLQHDLAGAPSVTAAPARRLIQEIQLIAASIRSSEGVLASTSQQAGTVIRR